MQQARWAGHVESRALTFRPVSGSFSSLSRTFSSVMVSCSGRMFAMGSGAQWLLKTCTGRQHAFQLQQHCNFGKDPESYCTDWCVPSNYSCSGEPKQATLETENDN